MQAKHSQTSKIVGHDNSMRVLCMFGLAVVPAKLHQADLNPLWSRALRDTTPCFSTVNAYQSDSILVVHSVQQMANVDLTR